MLRYTGTTTCAPALNDAGGVWATGANGPSISTSCSGRSVRWAACHARPSAWVLRLRQLRILSANDEAALEAVMHRPVVMAPNQILFHEDGVCDHVCVLLEGLACRYRILSEGRRQILGYVFPGDVCDVQFVTARAPDHCVGLVTESRVTRISRARLLDLLHDHPVIADALSESALIEQATLRQWLLNVGQRNAVERLAHFLCEFAARLEGVGDVHADGSFPCSINQVALADTIGLTTVHTNRTLQALRAKGLIELRQKRLTILDRAGLEALAGFEGSYLQNKTRQA